MTTGKREQISGTTLPQTTDILFSPSGNRMVVISEPGRNSRTYSLGTITKNDQGNISVEQTLLPSAIENYKFDTAENILFYTITNSNSTTGYSFDINTNDTTKLFEVPFTQIVTLWYPDNDSNYIYNKASSLFDGYLYKIVENNKLEKVANGRGLTAKISKKYVLVGTTLENERNTILIESEKKQPVAISTSGYPEKCVFAQTNDAVLWCTDSVFTPSGQHPDDWYQGSFSFDDNLWKVDLSSGVGTLVDTFDDEGNLVIDTINTTISDDDSFLFFINKIDGTLWVYNLRSLETTN